MSLPPSFTSLLNSQKKVISGVVNDNESLLKYFNSISEFLADCNVPSYETFASIESFKIEPTAQKANSVLISLCSLFIVTRKVFTMKDFVLSKALRFPMGLQFEELQSYMKATDILKTADEPVIDFYNAFIGNNAEELITCYKEIKDVNEKCTKSYIKEAIIIRIFQILVEKKSINLVDIKKMLDFVPWFIVEVTLLKRASDLEFKVKIDLSSGKIFIEKVEDKKIEGCEITNEIIESEKTIIKNKTKAFNEKIAAIEYQREKKRLEEEARRREEEEDARLEREYLEKKKREEEEEKARKKEEMRKIKADSAAEMQKLYRIQEKVRIKEEKDKQMKNLFERYFYHERARRMVERNFTDRKVEEEAEEIREMYRLVCESKQEMKKAEHERKVAMKKKFTNPNALQTWLDSIGKGESEEEKMAKIEKARKEKEEAERIAREKAEEERKAKLLEEQRKREEEKKRQEEEAFKRNQERIEKQQSSDEVYRPKMLHNLKEDKDGWMSARKDQRPSNSGVPSFVGGSSRSQQQRGNGSSDTYTPPRTGGSGYNNSAYQQRPGASSSVASFTSKRSSGYSNSGASFNNRGPRTNGGSSSVASFTSGGSRGGYRKH
ncbi:hypothetical protein EHI8A_014890 [Entamoeba histolytica HM-1:IMSS-B]|uniref:PCI domain-containing protein n=6 Tax=Entamoeba histolytica TaxID=5759 RepID=C4M816_ENTH1|nr:hypothetical protein, conserved [Entamoeba histolytica HM-1:IMSS]EMD43394.1 Hypothetical protein EHI5A_037080 [Entamoeba histolytica KU27]EMH72363.1 hypothetical protein EHI8A_014890 [Entamoeba histolytica HM-1:IMSS-B]EMS17227.1 hypothetical protein KM1_045820 [Entamoeba histolytica HM-3:IMSS]ENY65268.1 hypothetical protein EHI7A_018980 [Entamoeba histolytica HM-1:IMSS-A]GAT97689.1 hypothetical protein conserved [Entamoeba histolytica]|eukprot:XP_652362.1 hypothetical protein, conserved [Entamoeba histolytica HM-1:IMSS]